MTDTTVYSYEAVSDTLISGKTFTVIRSGNDGSDIFVRQSGDSVYRYSFRYGFPQEFLYFDFSRSAGDTVSSTVFGTDTMDVVLFQTEDVPNLVGALMVRA
jgi:hypothetical protein